MSTLLTDIVRRQSALSVIGIFNRVIEKVVENLADDLLREPEFREQMRQLVRVAFQQALKELNEPAPPIEPRRP